MEKNSIDLVQLESSRKGSPLNYKAITKEKIMPTREHGMGKVIIEIVDLNLLNNTLLLRDWVIIQKDDGTEIYRSVIKDIYTKKYSDNKFSEMLLTCGNHLGIVLTNEDTLKNLYSKLKEIIDIAALLINQIDPPYGLKPNSFEKYFGN